MANEAITRNLQVIGHFRIGELLGFNGLAATFKGFDQTTETEVAIVAIHEGDLANQDAYDRFVKDFLIIKDFPASRLCQPIGCGRDASHVWAAYEWQIGTHLGIQVRDHGVPDLVDAFQWMGETAGALATLHRNGPHLVINPASVFITNFRQAKLLHSAWGTILLNTAGGIRHPSMGSILPFLAPEIARGDVPEENADVYSLGALLYYLITGMPIHWHEDPGTLCQMIAETPPDLEPLRSELTPRAFDLLEELLSKDPSDRPINMPALADRFFAIVNEVAEAARQAAEQEAARRESAMEQDIAEARAEMAAQAEANRQTAPADPSGNRLADVLRERHADLESGRASAASSVPPPPPQPEAPAPAAPAKKKGPTGMIVGIAVALAVVVLAVGGAGAVFMMGGFGESEDEEIATPQASQGEDALQVALRYDQTAESLRRVGQMHLAFYRSNGRWALSFEELTTLGAKEEDFVDAWGQKAELRGAFVISSGKDKTWDTDDDVWWDAEKNVPGGFRPEIQPQP